MEWMLKWGAEYNRRLELVFPAPDGEPLAPNSLTKMLRRLMARAGHRKGSAARACLPACAATSLLSAGHNAVAVSKRLGHSKVVITLDVYGHAAAGRGRRRGRPFRGQARRPGEPKK